MRTLILIPELLTLPEPYLEDITAPGLQKLLSFARRRDTGERNMEQSTMRYFGFDVPAVDELPVAEMRWLGDMDTTAQQPCVCADPVHLLADTDHARLLGPDSLSLSMPEAQALVEALNQTFAVDGIKFIAATEKRWYVTGRDGSPLKTWPVRDLIGRNLASFLPEGTASADWRRLTTEVQMLLFSHPVNQVRQRQGLLSVNGLWFWGGGNLSSGSGSKLSGVISDSAFVRGLCAHTRVEVHAQTDLNYATKAEDLGGDYLLVDTGISDAVLQSDFATWRKRLQQLEQGVFQPLWQNLLAGKVQEVILNPGAGVEFRVQRPGVQRWWRREKPLKQFIQKEKSI